MRRVAVNQDDDLAAALGQLVDGRSLVLIKFSAAVARVRHGLRAFYGVTARGVT